MFPYLLVLVVGSLYFFLGKNLAQNKKLLLFFFLYVSLFIGLGDMIGGYDRYIYGEIFDSIADWVRGRNRFIDFTYLIQGNEYGYFVWQLLVSMITPNRYILLFYYDLSAASYCGCDNLARSQICLGETAFHVFPIRIISIFFSQFGFNLCTSIFCAIEEVLKDSCSSYAYFLFNNRHDAFT